MKRQQVEVLEEKKQMRILLVIVVSVCFLAMVGVLAKYITEKINLPTASFNDTNAIG